MSRVHVLVSSVFYSYGTCHAHTWPNVLCHTHCILRVCFCVCVCTCVCSLYWLSLSGLRSADDRRMGSLRKIPHRLIQTQKELSLSAFWSHCVFIKICGCVCVVVRGFACACVNASVCVGAVTCSLCSLRALSLGEPLIWSTGDSYSVK